MEQVGRYEIVRRMEPGGKSAVFLGMDPQAGREVVIKMVRVADRGDAQQLAQAREQLYAEIEAARGLTHPQIAATYDIFEEAGLIWVATELVKGKSLAKLLSEDKPPSRETVLQILRQVAEGLDYAHHRGVIHRHLKPANIVLQPEGGAKLLDFGLGRDPAKEGSTGNGGAPEVSAYLSPEQLAGDAADARSDQFSLGVIAYQLLAGTPPFSGDNLALRHQILKQDPPPPEQLNPTLGQETGQVLGYALAKDPSGRYKYCVDFVEALEAALDSARSWAAAPPRSSDLSLARVEGGKLNGSPRLPPEPVPSPISAESPPPETDDHSQRLRIVTAVSVALACLTVAWLLYLVWQRQPAAKPVGELAIKTDLPAAGLAGTPYSETLVAEGGSPPYSWSLIGGSLPPTFWLESSTGTIRGIPASVGEFAFEVRVTDTRQVEATQKLTLRVGSDLQFSEGAALPRGVVNEFYSHTLVVSGGAPPHRWSILSGSLPAALSLDPLAGRITGRPGVAGTFPLELQVSDSTGATTTQEVNLIIGSGLTVTTPPDLPAGLVQRNYSHRLAVGGGTAPYQWSVSDGLLPPGIGLDSSAGVLRGRPSEPGVFRFRLRVRDATESQATQAFSLGVGERLLIRSASELPIATLDGVYAQNLDVAGGTWPYRWAVTEGALPPGLTLNPSNGLIRGKPSEEGTFRFEVSVTDAYRSKSSQDFTLMVAATVAIATDFELPEADAMQPYSHYLVAVGGTPPYSWSIVDGALPPGLSLDLSSGVIGGWPQASGEFQFTGEVTDQSQTQSRRLFQIRVNSALQFAAKPALPAAVLGKAYSNTIEISGGKPPNIWSLASGTLPPGLTLDPASGRIEGTPSQPGRFRFNLQVVSSSKATVSQRFNLAVNPPPPGEIHWHGQLPADSVLTIHDGKYASPGSLSASLPAVPMKIELEPRDLTLVTAPGPENDWKLLVIHSKEPRTEITIRWRYAP